MEENLKKLLLKDLCSRLPYKVMCKYSGEIPMIGEVTNNIGMLSNIHVDKECPFEINGGIYGFADAKPYLRPMSSMTEEEKKELERLIDEKLNRNTSQEEDEWTPWILHDTTGIRNSVGGERFYFDEMSFIYDWLNERHFDYRGLIEKNLALEASEGMYNLND